MIGVGIDIGSTTTKVVVFEERNGIIVSRATDTGDLPGETASALFADAMSAAKLEKSDVQAITTTGYGRRLADFGDVIITEIKACAKGVARNAADASIRTIIDVGGQDTKVVALDAKGAVEDFSMNDKCAAGTGRFLEVLAHKLNSSYDEFVKLALRSDTLLQMNSTCAVFAESEVVGMLARGVPKQDIAAAAHNAIASRIASMIRRVGQGGEYCFVGGGACNAALVQAIETHLESKLIVPREARIIVALGAAIGGIEKYRKAGNGDDAD